MYSVFSFFPYQEICRRLMSVNCICIASYRFDKYLTNDFYCVLVLFTEVKMTFVVLLRSISPPGKLKNMPGDGGNRTYDFWNISPMLCQMSCAIKFSM